MPKPRKYATGTTVPVGRTQEQLRRLVIDRGATGWAIGEDSGRAVVQFRLLDRMLRFTLNVGDCSSDRAEERRRWRALHMAIKAKLVIAEDGIETFDEVFLPNIVTGAGDTIAERLVPELETIVKDGARRLLIPERCL